MKSFKIYLTAIIMAASSMACDSFLDVIPDNVSTIDHAFTLRQEAEKYLFTCYSYLPDHGSPSNNIGLNAGDEAWFPTTFLGGLSTDAPNIARGNQNISNPYMNFWDGDRGGRNYFQAIRDCNIFLENVRDENKIPDLEIDERLRWVGEVEFLKAYYHFYLLRMYGPIPIIDENLPISATPEQVRIKREPVDDVVEYIAGLLDQAAEKLPARIQTEITDLGHVTQPAALTLKAKLLVMAASPLFNGNPDYSDFTDHDGVHLFSTSYDPDKWEEALAACGEAIAACEEVGIRLYEYQPGVGELSEETITQLSLRNSVTERWNDELIWGLSGRRVGDLQRQTMAYIDPSITPFGIKGNVTPPIKIVEMFYTKNGVPIEEDRTLDFSNKTSLRTATHEERFNLIEGYPTARVNYDREPRFYASLGFVGGVWYMYNSPSNSDENTWRLRIEQTRINDSWSLTGYHIKKLVNLNFAFQPGRIFVEEYAWPEMRLADLYLLYAEAKNEVDGPSPEVYNYLNLIRERAGLGTVEDSWSQYSSNPNKYKSKEGLREIIHHERMIELAFEGSRFWDLRRWKKAAEVLNAPIKGWDVQKTNSLDAYYRYRTLYSQQFIAPRDYFWPIRENNLRVNPNLVQNPGW